MTKTDIRKHQELKKTLTATSKFVNIQIAAEDLQALKDNNYMLCFAKKVGDSAYNVVWQAYGEYLSTNSFSWTPQYQLFGSNTFQSNLTVITSTNIVNIGLGETSTLNSAGLLSDPPISGGPITSVTMVNDYGKIHPGVNQVSTGVDGNIVSTPIYVAENAAIQGTVTLTPVEKVMVWFQQEVETSTMFSDIIGTPVEIDLTITDSAARLYSDGKWTTV
tara:strand:- start:933 stop:1589 length:657 start_codon:yes stop_codon:yes gene_type:complete